MVLKTDPNPLVFPSGGSPVLDHARTNEKVLDNGRQQWRSFRQLRKHCSNGSEVARNYSAWFKRKKQGELASVPVRFCLVFHRHRLVCTGPVVNRFFKLWFSDMKHALENKIQKHVI